MRKKPTYEELANSTLAKSVVDPINIPYIPPNDNTAAIAEFKRMLAEEGEREIIGERFSAAASSAARESGLPREFFENLARNVVTEGSRMHAETRKQSQDAAAAATRLTQLQTETLLREHATAQQGIQENINMQRQVRETMNTMPTNMVDAVLAAMQSSGAASSTPTGPPPAPPPADPPTASSSAASPPAAPEDIPVDFFLLIALQQRTYQQLM